MKRQGLLNPQLCAAIARLGHTDTFVVADCGLPVPRDVPVVDLALVFGIPRFAEVLSAVLSEVVVDHAVIAGEAVGAEPEEWVRGGVDRVLTVPPEELKRQVADASFVVRTGETTPLANVVVHCGVPF
ncbi:MAG: D-ribose pyranase [Acidipropionibacterium jensenii]|nr:D-ribose pyranase [Acidipropionibacterium jensenii]